MMEENVFILQKKKKRLNFHQKANTFINYYISNEVMNINIKVIHIRESYEVNLNAVTRMRFFDVILIRVKS